MTDCMCSHSADRPAEMPINWHHCPAVPKPRRRGSLSSLQWSGSYVEGSELLSGATTMLHRDSRERWLNHWNEDVLKAQTQPADRTSLRRKLDCLTLNTQCQSTSRGL